MLKKSQARLVATLLLFIMPFVTLLLAIDIKLSSSSSVFHSEDGLHNVA